MKDAAIRVNGQRLWDSIMAMAEIGPGERGGSRRLALTDEDRDGRNLFIEWCRAAGCDITVDDMGNIFARRPGRNPEAAPVCAGSHLDTQPHGGRFDGIYGVLAALEVVRTLNDHGIETEAPIEVIDWTNEEGARFAPAMVASGVFAGLFEKEYAWSRTDNDGRTQKQELERIGFLGEQPCGEHPMAALFEAHIEQGPILEHEGKPIGVVTGAQGIRWLDVTVHGRDSHAGSTPMPVRKDALVAAAELVQALQAIALEHAPDSVATVGRMHVSPDSRNTIPGEVFLSVDFRNPDDAVIERMAEQVEARRRDIAERHGVEIKMDEIWRNPAVVFDEKCVHAVRNAAQALGHEHRDMVSGAGHDACQVCRVAPTAMIFVPCEGGLSHNEDEHATPEDLEAGCNVLLHAMLETAGRAG